MKEKKKRHRPQSSTRNDAHGIGQLLSTMYVPLQSTVLPEKERCRFDMFVRWSAKVKREKHVFTYRGDQFGDTDPAKMLWSLLRFFINKHGLWFYVELYDNTKPKNDPNRYLLKYSAGVIMENRLSQLKPLLENYPVPEWLGV